MRDALEEVWARSVEDKLFEDINLMSEEQYDEFLDSLNEEELDEIIGRDHVEVETQTAQIAENPTESRRPTNRSLSKSQGEKCYKDRIRALLEKQRKRVVLLKKLVVALEVSLKKPKMH